MIRTKGRRPAVPRTRSRTRATRFAVWLQGQAGASTSRPGGTGHGGHASSVERSFHRRSWRRRTGSPNGSSSVPDGSEGQRAWASPRSRGVVERPSIRRSSIRPRRRRRRGAPPGRRAGRRPPSGSRPRCGLVARSRLRARREHVPRGPHRLTAPNAATSRNRQLEASAPVAHGRRNADIAERLWALKKTVDDHVPTTLQAWGAKPWQSSALPCVWGCSRACSGSARAPHVWSNREVDPSSSAAETCRTTFAGSGATCSLRRWRSGTVCIYEAAGREAIATTPAARACRSRDRRIGDRTSCGPARARRLLGE